MAGWITTPHAYGLTPLSKICQLCPSPSTRSAGVLADDITANMPRRPCNGSGAPVNPPAASSPAQTPASAAWPAWNGLVMVPNCSRWPAACVAAMLRQCVAVLPVEAEQPDGNGRRSEGAGGAGHVPAGVVVLGVERVTGAGGELVAQRMRGEQLDTPGAPPFGQRRSRGVQRRRRMEDRRHVGVIEIQCMTSDSVDQCRVGDAQPVWVPSAMACGSPPSDGTALWRSSRRVPRRPRQRGRGDRAGTGCSRAARRRGCRRRRCDTRSRARCASRRRCDRHSGVPGCWCHVVCITEFLSV